MAFEDTKDLNRLWQEQPAEEVRMKLEDTRARALKLKNRGDRRNLREYAAAVVVLVACIAWGLREKNVVVIIGAGLMVLGTLYVVYHLHRYGTVRSMPSDLGLKDCLDFHRAELVRQRDLLRRVWWWYLLPFVPAWALILIGRLIEHPDRWLRALGAAAIFAASFIVIGKLNERAARRLQSGIEDLDRAR
jgi:hypothetical protein